MQARLTRTCWPRLSGSRDRNADLEARNTELEAQSMQFEAFGEEEGAAPACAGAVCGTVPEAPPASNGKNAEMEITTLPNELLLAIADYFEPGTRDLLHFARASRNLYELLIPRLYERISLPNIDSTLFHAAARPSSANPRDDLPSGLRHVRVLDVVDMVPFATCHQLLKCCGNLVELAMECSRYRSDLDTFMDLNFPRLQKLIVWAGPGLERGVWPPGVEPAFPLVQFPNLKELVLRGTATFALMEYLAASLSHLESVSFEFDLFVPVLTELRNLDPEFVRKIKNTEAVLVISINCHS